MAEKPIRVSDVIGCPYYPINEYSGEQLDGKEFTIEEFTIREGMFGPEAHILCSQGDPEFCFRTTSTVVMEQLDLLKDKLPLIGGVRRQDRYYTLQ